MQSRISPACVAILAVTNVVTVVGGFAVWRWLERRRNVAIAQAMVLDIADKIHTEQTFHEMMSQNFEYGYERDRDYE